jgi:putative SOS response-associated peptidase YedK
MCNLYSLTKSQAAIHALFRVPARDLTGNLPPLPGIFPDGMVPVIRTGSDGEHELAMLRVGYAVPAGLWRPARHPHPQYQEPALARVARKEPLPRAVHELLRIH